MPVPDCNPWHPLVTYSERKEWFAERERPYSNDLSLYDLVADGMMQVCIGAAVDRGEPWGYDTYDLSDTIKDEVGKLIEGDIL